MAAAGARLLSLPINPKETSDEVPSFNLLKSARRAAAAAASRCRASRRAQGAYKAEYKMSRCGPPAFAWGKGGEIWADLVRERTSGRINIKQYPGASLVQGEQTASSARCARA